MAKSHHIQLVWFKRDLRLEDHAALCQAAAAGPVLCVYTYEPSLIAADEYHPAHLHFINECLAELRQGLRRLGGDLLLLRGELPEAFARLHAIHPFEAIWAHEETGNGATYARDRRVAAWCREREVAFQELPQNGVIRRLKNRDGWAEQWRRRMAAPRARLPERVAFEPVADYGALAMAGEFGLELEDLPERQRGGMSAARETLGSFLAVRGVDYRRAMSSPVTAFDSCSRLSTYLAYGAISHRTVHQATEEQRREVGELLRANAPVDRRWAGSLSSFAGRLRWHCHFMQKLEDEPSIEHRNFARTLDGLREDDFNEERFQAWCAGRTGYPMIDACMRAVHRHGWINFRMRAMLASFSAYHLWLHWRRPAVYLGRWFLDFEPGIHYSQFQMQSGTTAINTIRIYSPAKQVIDHDPTGVFIRRYVPELAEVPDKYLAEPHRMPRSVQEKAGCLIGHDYAAPIVDHATAYKEARARLGAWRKAHGTWQEAQTIQKRHGSRRRPGDAPAAKRPRKPAVEEPDLFGPEL